jgi:hypothetical protein
VSDNELAQLIQALVPGQPPGQLTQGRVAPPGGPLVQLTEVVTVGQPAGQPQLGHIIPGVGQRADDLDGFLSSGPVGQPAGQLPPSMLVPGLGMLAQLPRLIVAGQLVSPPPPFRVLRGIAQRMGHRHNLAHKEGPECDQRSAAPSPIITPGNDLR